MAIRLYITASMANYGALKMPTEVPAGHIIALYWLHLSLSSIFVDPSQMCAIDQRICCPPQNTWAREEWDFELCTCHFWGVGGLENKKTCLCSVHRCWTQVWSAEDLTLNLQHCVAINNCAVCHSQDKRLEKWKQVCLKYLLQSSPETKAGQTPR